MCQNLSPLPACRRLTRTACALIAAIAVAGCDQAVEAATVAALPMPLFHTSAAANRPYCPTAFKGDSILTGPNANAVFKKVTDIGTGRVVRNTYAGTEVPSRVLHPSLLDRWIWCAKKIMRSMARGA